MSKLPRWVISLTILSFTIFFGARGNALTPTPTGPSGLTVSPALQQQSINQGEASHPIKFKITNNESITRSFRLSVADFNTLGESGGLFFVGTNPTDLQKKYGLAKWISLPQKTVTLQAFQSATIEADVLNLPDLTPGGHYGALMLEAVDTNQSQTTPNKVAVHPIASSLLFVTKLGGDTHKLGLSNVNYRHSLVSLPGSVTLRFHNDGNTHVIPRGLVSLISPSGSLISKGILNQDSNIILPETSRLYYVQLQQASSSKQPGRYKVKVDFRFDGLSQYRSFQQTFWYLSVSWIILAVITLIGILAIIKLKLLNAKKR